MNFTLRNFRREDFEILWRIDQQCFPPRVAYSRLELATYIRRKGSFTLVAEVSAANHDEPVAETSGGETVRPKIAGFIVAESGRRGIGHIISIDVLGAARRSGIGSKLLAAAEDRLRSIPCHSIVLETAVDNASALAFYKRHGYHVMKTIPRYYSNGVDAFVMEKDLARPAEADAADHT